MVQKTQLIALISAHLKQNLEYLERSASSAKDEATNEESKPENRYDTRALEASYLAGAQEARIAELKSKLTSLIRIKLKFFSDVDPIGETALVEVKRGSKAVFYFILDVAAGIEITDPTNSAKKIICISSQSPLGTKLLGRIQGELIDMGDDNRSVEMEVLRVE
ncbi:MAG: hypothetical protein NT027_12040 [Proteobacteria bacterium]|nr:hypothetical protein [Pseudomonadota bacterium]